MSQTVTVKTKNQDNFIQYVSNLVRGFWPFFLLSLFISLLISFFYLRYATYFYESSAKIEILDKAQDSEMALPTSMTIFNRSMINLENEIGVLSSFRLNSKVVSDLNSNVKFFTVGSVKTSENYKDEWLEDYDLKLKVNADTVLETKSYRFFNDNNILNIEEYTEIDGFTKNYLFPDFSTFNKKHDLPFDISVNSKDFNQQKIIKLVSFNETVEFFQNSIKMIKSGENSDQLDISLNYPNVKIADEYLNKLIYEFDLDGIRDRQLEYKRTIEFVDNRSVILKSELDLIESKKQQFLANNSLSDLSTDALISIEQKSNYDSEIFKSKSQRDLVFILKESLLENKLSLLPVNIGIENSNLNSMIAEYNLLLRQRNRFKLNAGPKNSFFLNLENQLNDYHKNILLSIDNFTESLNLNIKNLQDKEKEFEEDYNKIPENAKILRSIERELEVKEALFLLLLQKKEEASINFAVVKPTIKLIDSARSLLEPNNPNKTVIYFIAIILGLLIPFTIIYIVMSVDNKINSKDELSDLIPNIPIIGEIPFIKDKNITNNIIDTRSRGILNESFRMINSNLGYVSKSDSKVFLITSTVKGEGKTIISVNLASILTESNKKVLLIGADLRNPQIHKFINESKTKLGLSDYLYRDDLLWRKLLIKHKNIDILLSGTIPPNPTELLSSSRIKDLIKEAEKTYDYIIIDSAPSLLVSDTFELSSIVDNTIYVVRFDYTERDLMIYLKETVKLKKLPNISVVFNSVGLKSKYGYSYNYNYNYSYSYNYGYGYGYEEKKSN